MNKIVIANWKMNPESLEEARELWKGVVSNLKNIKNTEVVICPPAPFLFLGANKGSNKKSRPVSLGAQDVFWESSGAHTGEISSSMISSMGASYAIVGHSDKRSAGDTNKIVNKKVLSLLRCKIFPVLCIGESARDDDGAYLRFIKNQIEECLSGVSSSQLPYIIIAYEPIWSISTNPNAKEDTPQDLLEMVIFIRKVISDIFSPKVAKEIRIIYGGSVNEKNASEFFKYGGVTGALVGHASLNAGKFIKIIKS